MLWLHCCADVMSSIFIHGLRFQKEVNLRRLRFVWWTLTSCCCLLGGLAVEEPRELVARGPCRCDPDAEETPAEHAHLHPGSAQKHEMETAGSAGTSAAFLLHTHTHTHTETHTRRSILFSVWVWSPCTVCLCSSVSVYVKNTPDSTDFWS